VSLIEAKAVVPAPREEVFAYLADFRNHCRLLDPWIDVLSFEPADGSDPDAPARGGRVRMRGPLGVSRTATTRVVAVEPPARLAGTAEVGHRTLARVGWTLEPAEDSTEVTLTAEVERVGPFDWVLLLLGGAAWMRRRFRSVLAMLAGAVAPRTPPEAGTAQPALSPARDRA
jgi:Polyketide cyclase / dehydrase and lipid transport